MVGKNLYLVGYRGSGKTTVAQHLAVRLGWPWVDADARLEERAGNSIREIFATAGEGAFRDLESQVLTDLAAQGSVIPTVVALGGGAILREENRQIMAQTGYAIWLRAQPEVLARRIAADPTTAERRPNLTAVGGLEEIRSLLAQREPLYQAVAQQVIDVDCLAPEQVAAEIYAWVELHLPPSGPPRTVPSEARPA